MECIPCNRRFKSERALEQHIQDSPAHAVSYNCISCNRSFNSGNALEQHTRDSHPVQYHCNSCNRSFNSENALEQHTRDSHPVQYNCNSCNRSFNSEGGLEQHIRDLHPAHRQKGNKSLRRSSAQEHIQTSPAHAYTYNQRWSMYPTHHEHVSSLLEAEGLHFEFYDVDRAEGCINDYDTNIMGRFICHNDSCSATGWSSKKIPITIRKYPGNKYNARVYHQRCERCNSLSRPVIDDESYAERVVYRIKKWSGIRILMGAPPPYFNSKGPHYSDLCEGCKAGHCRAV
ncbi:hypothetical protein GX51_05959 [Blastomyces parvus]|uniref:C2H2-type domain-containing protein n=1 Tax=Blastomyces parvus TaxID=2060905 RepID=A0A2B7WTL6_9EURO|nr:hypothetical protein GX51_05959 [Blastomyces parvus]